MPELMKGNCWSERKDAKDRKGNPIVTFPVIAEVKYDEIRCHVVATELGVKFLSYAGKPLLNLHYWESAFSELMAANDLLELDIGVLVNANFNDSYRWVRSKKVPEGLNPDMVQFMFFDSPMDTRKYYERRHLMYCLARDAANVWGLNATTPKNRVCDNEEQLNAVFVEVREQGFEGLMVKDPHHTYQKGKRIDGWLKMKPEESFDGKIVAVNQAFAADGTPHDRAGSVDVVLEDGSRASPAGFTWSLARAMWQNPERYIGQWIEFKCMERDRQGGYRHPSYVRFREAKA